MASSRPTISGTRHVIAAGHYLATHAGFQILEAGGNAVDAGVCAGICLGVLQTEKVNFGGVAPMIIFRADTREVISIDGLGVWPRMITPDFFQKHHGGKIPPGVLRSVVPMALNLLKGFDLQAMGHNSPEYIHTVTEALKLTFADRHHHFGDPGFISVPMAGLLSEDSFEPHPYFPGLLKMEKRIAADTGARLSAKGHRVEWWDEWTWLAGAPCAIVVDQERGILHGGADPRRPAYVLGW